MIDHVYISVTNIEKSLAFYLEALKPLGWPVRTMPPLVPAPSRTFTVSATTPTYPAAESDRASGCASASLARRGCISASCVTPTTPLMPPMPPRSAPAASTRAGLPTAHTLPRAITPPTSLTSTATAWSSCAKPGTLRAKPGAVVPQPQRPASTRPRPHTTDSACYPMATGSGRQSLTDLPWAVLTCGWPVHETPATIFASKGSPLPIAGTRGT